MLSTHFTSLLLSLTAATVIAAPSMENKRQAGLKTIILTPDYGFDPTESAIPWSYLTSQSADITFASENGVVGQADTRMLDGLWAFFAGAKEPARNAYAEMITTPAFQAPLSWSKEDFSLEEYDLVLLPGGHDKGVKQLIESPTLRQKLIDYFPGTEAGGKKTVAAICHGAMAVAWTNTTDGKSILHNRRTTTLPEYMEESAFLGSKLFLGDYYLTYPFTRTQNAVTSSLDTPEQFEVGPTNMLLSYDREKAFVVVDEGYVSSRWPGDAEVFGEKLFEVAKQRSGK